MKNHLSKSNTVTYSDNEFIIFIITMQIYSRQRGLDEHNFYQRNSETKKLLCNIYETQYQLQVLYPN